FKNEAYGNSTGSYDITDLATGLKRDAMSITFLLSAPGPKMIWTFEELGYDDASAGPNYGNLHNTGDKRTDPQPPHWDYLQNLNRKALYDWVAKMIHYKTQNEVFSTTDYTYNLAGAVKQIQLTGAGGTIVKVIGNFDVVPHSVTLKFPKDGEWIDNVSGNHINITSSDYSVTLAPGEYHLYSNQALNK